MKKKVFSLFTTFVILFAIVGIMPKIEVGAICCRKGNFDKSKYTLTGNMAQDVATIAKSQKGRTCDQFGYSGVDYGYWCDEFVADCIENAGADSSIVGHGGTVADFETIMKKKGAKPVDSPQAGDLVFFTYSHVEIVTKVSNGIVYSAGGNNGTYPGMCQGEHTVSKVRLYLRPNYPNSNIKPHGHVMSESEGAGQTIPDGDYWIVNGLSTRYLVDILGDNYNTANGTNLQMHLWNTNKWGEYDVFTIKYLNNGFYSITQRTTNMCVDVSGGKLLAEANVNMWTKNNSNAQQWSIKKTANGYTLQSRCCGFYLDVKGGKTDNCNLQVYEGNGTKSQLFSFIPYNAGQPIKDGVYRIGTINGKGAYIDAAGEPGEYKNGSNVQIWDAGADNYFKLEYCKNGFYKIYDNVSGLALDVNNPSSNDYLNRGANVQLYTSKDTLGQYWAIKSVGNGYYYIISKLNGYYLDLDNGKTTNGTNIHTWSGAGNTQKWSFVTNKSLSVTAPKKTTYYIGDKLDTTGMIVKMNYSDGSSLDVTKNVKISCDMSTAGTKNVTVTYEQGGLKSTASFAITVKKYAVTIHYNTNGGTVASDSNYYAASNGDIYRKSDNKLMGPTWENGYKDSNGLTNASTVKLSRSGYQFLGWSLQKSGGKIYDQDDASVSANDLFPQVTSKNGTVMLYAQWAKNSVTIHYNANGGTVASDSDFYIGSNNDIYSKSNNKLMAHTWENEYKGPNGLYNAATIKLTKSGYTFLGWSLQKSGGKIYDQDDNTVSANDLFPQIISKSGTVMLYAQWAKNTVTIHYNTNGGSIASDSNYYSASNGDIYRKSDNKLMGPTWENGYKDSNGLTNASTVKLSRTGYQFLGWSLQKSNGKIYDQDDNTISANDLFPDVKNKNGTVMLYAQWKSNIGDVNDDGLINVTDAVLLQKWLLAVPGATLSTWQNADLYEDGRIDVFDLILLKRLLINS